MRKDPPRLSILRALIFLLIAGGIALLVWALYGQGEDLREQTDIMPHFYNGKGLTHTLENSWLRFDLDGDTTQFTVTAKADGHIWRSVPQGAATDPLALAGTKNLLQSTLALTYSTDNGVRTLYDSYEYSIKNQVYEILADEEQIKVSYTLGQVQRAYIIPGAISLERMDGFLSTLTKAQGRKILDSYRKYDPAKLSDSQKAELLPLFPMLENGVIYVLRDNVKEFLKGEFEALLKEAGYTYDDYLSDQAAGSASLGDRGAVFSLSVIYSLEGKDLIVKVPMDEIGYMQEYPPVRLNLLPNFGAGGEKDEGYILVPEGGGGIIDFNNGKITQNSYFANIYGWDYASWRTALVHETNARFPVFGMVNNDSAFLCILEELSSSASLAGDISGRSNSFNTASASYALLHSDAFNVTDRTIETIYMYEQALPKGAIVQRYRFLPTDDYVELAKAYREYLQERYPGLKPLDDKKVPVSVEILGAIDKVQQKGGLPVSSPIRLTSYPQAAEMVKAIAGWTDSQLHVRLSGWMNGGVKQKILQNAKPLGQLGGEAALDALIKEVKQSGALPYLNGITAFALDSGPLDGFVSLRDAARFTTREQVKLYQYSNIWYGVLDMREPYYLLKPAMARQMTANLARSALSRGASGVAFEDLGRLLSADYNPKETVTREEVLLMQREDASRLRADGLGVMVRGGNLYALEFADIVTDTDLEGVRYAVFDDNVPFVQIALHGLVRYTGKPLNLANDWEQELLLSAQRGAGLSFVFMKEEPLALHDTDYPMYYGASFDLWEQDAQRILREYKEKLGGVFGQAITSFKRLPGSLSVTGYEDGTRVIVNFSHEARELDGLVIDARSYGVIKGEVSR